MTHIPTEDLLAEIQRLTDGDTPPSTAEMQEHGAYSVMTYYDRFGSWKRAVREAVGSEKAANLQWGTKIPTDELLAEIRRLAEDGQLPTQAEMDEQGRYSAATYQRRFGSWFDAVVEAANSDQ